MVISCYGRHPSDTKTENVNDDNSESVDEAQLDVQFVGETQRSPNGLHLRLQKQKKKVLKKHKEGPSLG